MVNDFNQKTSYSFRRRGIWQFQKQKCQAKSGFKIIKRKRHLIYFLPFGIIFALIILQIYLSNKLATFGTHLLELEKEIAVLEENNRSLKSEIALQGGLNELAKIAYQKGYIKISSVTNFSNKFPIAMSSQ